MKMERRAALEALAKDYGDAAQRARFLMSMTTSDDGPAYSVAVLGVVRDRRSLIVSAPTTIGNQLITVVKGRTVLCRWINQTTVFRFRAAIVKLGFEPVPVCYLDLPGDIERKVIHRQPRALLNMHAMLRRPEQVEAVTLQLSVSSARLALSVDERIQLQDTFELVIRPRMLERSFLLTLQCTVTAVMGATDAKHPRVQFIDVEFGNLTDLDLMTLHACVQEHLAHETDWLTHVLS